MSVIAATYQFRNELKDLKIDSTLREKYLQQFLEAFKRSGDYDLATSRIFERIMNEVEGSRKSAFKDYWHELNKGNDPMIDAVQSRSDDLANREVKPGVDWKQAVIRIAKILVIEFGIALIAAFAIALRSVNKK